MTITLSSAGLPVYTRFLANLRHNGVALGKADHLAGAAA